MKMTPLDIQNQQFSVRMRGFDVREVDAFLDLLAETFETMLADKERLEAEVQRCRQETQAYREREDTFKRAILNSQKVVEQMKANARKSADVILADAEVKAEKIIQRAHNRLAQLHEDIDELKRQRMQIELQIQAIIDNHSRMLEMTREDMKTVDDEDAKVKVLK